MHLSDLLQLLARRSIHHHRKECLFACTQVPAAASWAAAASYFNYAYEALAVRLPFLSRVPLFHSGCASQSAAEASFSNNAYEVLAVRPDAKRFS